MVLFALSTLVDNVIVAVLDGVIAVCYLVGVAAVICVVSGVEVYESTAVNGDGAEGGVVFINVEEVTVAKVILIGRECTTIDDDYALSGSIDACTAAGCEGAVFNSNICTVGSGNYARIRALCAARHCTVTGDGYYGVFAFSPKNVADASPVSRECVTVEIDFNVNITFEHEIFRKLNVGHKLNVVSCRENCLEVGFVGDFNGCAFFNDCNLIFALASGTIVENAVNDHILVSTVTGCFDFYLGSVATTLALTSFVSVPTDFGAGGSLCLVFFEVVIGCVNGYFFCS